jgi:hypothetical protein
VFTDIPGIPDFLNRPEFKLGTSLTRMRALFQSYVIISLRQDWFLNGSVGISESTEQDWVIISLINWFSSERRWVSRSSHEP